MAFDGATLREHLSREFGLDVAELTDRTPLFSSGMVDSFALVDLIVWLELRTGIRVGVLDVTLENLDTIERIVAYVRHRTGGED